MSKPESIKRSGLVFVAGAFAFITLLSGSDPIAIPGSVVSAILLAVGMSGLRSAYGEHTGSLGRSMLMLGMLGRSVVDHYCIYDRQSNGDSGYGGFMGLAICRARNLITWLDIVWTDRVTQ